MKFSGVHQLFGYPYPSIIFFCVREKKETHTVNK